MSERIAIVTGGASGIGRAVATGLSEAGHHVMVVDRPGSDGGAVAGSIGGEFIGTDLSTRAGCRDVVDLVIERHARVEILVNNAGFQHIDPIEEFPEDRWDEMIAVMLTAPFLLTRYAWPSMKTGGWGRIVNMASIHSVRASPFKVGYISAKHGLIGLTRTAAREGGEFGITVNAISPSYVRTPLVENQITDQARTRGLSEDEVVEQVMLAPASVKRLIEPEEIAALVVYLCSDAASAVTGANWTIDAGWTAG